MTFSTNGVQDTNYCYFRIMVFLMSVSQIIFKSPQFFISKVNNKGLAPSQCAGKNLGEEPLVVKVVIFKILFHEILSYCHLFKRGFLQYMEISGHPLGTTVFLQTQYLDIILLQKSSPELSG